uniref:Uncharacterized protein n=1 Tax=Plectus sambesii TaxID=2011161 RepID=A0A914W6G2_9BILA
MSLLSRLSITSLLLASAAALTCRICDHMGHFSMTPPDAPNSRLVVDRHAINCTESDIECDEDEDFCIMAYARDAHHRYWVQKGCTASYRSRAMHRLREQSLACLTEWISPSQVRDLPVHPSDHSLQLNVCICKGEDGCNEGDRLMGPANSAPSAAIVFHMLSTVCSLLAALFTTIVFA